MKKSLILLSSITSAFCEGYYLHEKSPLFIPVIQDASLLYYNVAGGIALASKTSQKVNASLSSSTYFVRAYLTNEGSTDMGGALRRGTARGSSNQTAVVPDTFISYSFNPKLAFNMTVSNPYGLNVGYEPAWFGRYEILKARIETTDAIPSVSYALTNSLSIGLGLGIRHVFTDFEKAVDFGGLSGNTSQRSDGLVKVKLRGNSKVLNVGVLWQGEKSFLGASFQTSDKVSVKGPVKFIWSSDGATASQVNNGAFVDTIGHVFIKYPAKILLHGGYDVKKNWKIFAETQFMTWGIEGKRELWFDNPRQPTDVVDYHYRNTWRFSVVNQFELTNTLKTWVGIGWCQTPVKTPYRRPELPDSNRKNFWVGASYNVSETCKFFATAAYFYYNNATINLASTAATGRLRAQAKPNVMVINGSLSFKI